MKKIKRGCVKEEDIPYGIMLVCTVVIEESIILSQLRKERLNGR